MIFYRAIDYDFLKIKKNNYDLAIFASGYEIRATYVSSQLSKINIDNNIILGFEEHNNDFQRKKNDEYYKNNWNPEQIILNSSDESKIYKILNEKIDINKKDIKILVDYSSMSRLWFAGIINWARYLDRFNSIIIDFVYAAGKHKEELKPMVIDNILAIPGCEGGAMSFTESIAVFGLGFDGLATLCVYDSLEPDIVYSYLAEPSIFEDYPKKAYEGNKELIVKYTKKLIKLSLFSVENTFRCLGELISPFLNTHNITLVPMGPKPHVLGSIILSMKFKEIVCLHVSGIRDSIEHIDTTGDLISTRVEFIA